VEKNPKNVKNSNAFLSHNFIIPLPLRLNFPQPFETASNLVCKKRRGGGTPRLNQDWSEKDLSDLLLERARFPLVGGGDRGIVGSLREYFTFNIVLVGPTIKYISILLSLIYDVYMKVL